MMKAETIAEAVSTRQSAFRAEAAIGKMAIGLWLLPLEAIPELV
jgi:hypothetical protein